MAGRMASPVVIVVVCVHTGFFTVVCVFEGADVASMGAQHARLRTCFSSSPYEATVPGCLVCFLPR